MLQMTKVQQLDLIEQARRHEALGAALRELAILRRPADNRMMTAPVIHGWRWVSECVPSLRGTWRRDGERGIVDGRVGEVVAHMPDMSAVLTLSGWFAMGVPDDVRALSTEVVQ